MATTLHCDWCGEWIEGGGEHQAHLRPSGQSEDGRSWFYSPRFQYHAVGPASCLVQALDALQVYAYRAHDEATPTNRPRPAQEVQRELRAAWKRMPAARREAYAFQLLGEERLTIGELADRFQAELEPDARLYETDIRSLVNRMSKAGQLEREPEQWRGRVRYRYLRKRALEGPIADLQATFDQDAKEGGA